MLCPGPGIGYAATQAFLREGAEVMAVDNNEEMLDKMLPNPGEEVEASASRWSGRGANCASGEAPLYVLPNERSLLSIQGDRHHRPQR